MGMQLIFFARIKMRRNFDGKRMTDYGGRITVYDLRSMAGDLRLCVPNMSFEF